MLWESFYDTGSIDTQLLVFIVIIQKKILVGRLNEMHFGGMYMECTRLFSSWWVLFIFPYRLTLIEFFTFEFRQKFFMLTEKSKNGFSFILSICLCVLCVHLCFSLWCLLILPLRLTMCIRNAYQVFGFWGNGLDKNSCLTASSHFDNSHVIDACKVKMASFENLSVWSILASFC